MNNKEFILNEVIHDLKELSECRGLYSRFIGEIKKVITKYKREQVIHERKLQVKARKRARKAEKPKLNRSFTK